VVAVTVPHEERETLPGDRRTLELSTRAHRQLIGYLGLLLPGLLYVLAGLRPTRDLPAWRLLGSVSAYYYTGAGGVFVGVLFGLGLFLFTYQGYADSRADRALGRVAAFCALCLALFPTTAPEGVAPPDWWNERMISIHNGAASLLFTTFSLFSLWLFRRSRIPKGRPLPPGKRFRNRVYLICGIVMIVCILWAGSALVWPRPVFWPEAIALWAFAVSWLVKGRAPDSLAASARWLAGAPAPPGGS
jgi:hypothetical protein